MLRQMFGGLFGDTFSFAHHHTYVSLVVLLLLPLWRVTLRSFHFTINTPPYTLWKLDCNPGRLLQIRLKDPEQTFFSEIYIILYKPALSTRRFCAPPCFIRPDVLSTFFLDQLINACRSDDVADFTGFPIPHHWGFALYAWTVDVCNDKYWRLPSGHSFYHLCPIYQIILNCGGRVLQRLLSLWDQLSHPAPPWDLNSRHSGMPATRTLPFAFRRWWNN